MPSNWLTSGVLATRIVNAEVENGAALLDQLNEAEICVAVSGVRRRPETSPARVVGDARRLGLHRGGKHIRQERRIGRCNGVALVWVTGGAAPEIARDNTGVVDAEQLVESRISRVIDGGKSGACECGCTQQGGGDDDGEEFHAKHGSLLGAGSLVRTGPGPRSRF